MTVSNTTNRTSATGSATVGQVIPFLFPVTDSSELVVKTRVTATGVEATLTETTDYTVTVNGDSGGSVTLVGSVAATSQIWVIRETPKTQALDLAAGGEFSAEDVEDGLDKTVKLAVDTADGIARALVAPNTDPASLDMTLPSSIDRASQYMAFDADGQPTVVASVAPDTATISAFAETLLDDASAADMRATLGMDDWLLDSYPANTVNVMNYGAVAGGVVNNAAAFEAARDAAGAGGTIFIPGGTYAFDSAIDPGDYRTWVGVGNATILLCTAANTDNAIFKESGTGVGESKFKHFKLASDNANAVGFDVDEAHYINHCTFEHIQFSASLYCGIKGVLGGCYFVSCEFGIDGSPGSHFQAVQSVPTTVLQCILVTFIRCRFYYGTDCNGNVEFGYANTITFISCLWEYNDVPSVYAQGASELLFLNCNWEVEEPSKATGLPGATNNCLIDLNYLTTLDGTPIGQGCYAMLRNCRLTNGASGSTSWAAIVFCDSGCFAQFDDITGGLNSTWLCLDSTGYDYNQTFSSRGLRHASGIKTTGYSGSSVIASNVVYERVPTTVIQGTDPAITLRGLNAGDTKWWIGITANEDSVDNDALEMGTGATKGSNVKFSLSSIGILSCAGYLVTISRAVSHDYAGGTSDWTLTLAEASGSEFTVTNASNNVNMIFQSALTGKVPFCVVNTSGHILTVKVSGQTGITIANGKTSICRFNSTDVVEVYEQP